MEALPYASIVFLELDITNQSAVGTGHLSSGEKLLEYCEAGSVNNNTMHFGRTACLVYACGGRTGRWKKARHYKCIFARHQASPRYIVTGAGRSLGTAGDLLVMYLLGFPVWQGY